MNVEAWLKKFGLEEHASTFAENGVDGSLLRELTNEDLKDLGIARLADRKRLLKAIAELSAADEAPLADAPGTEQELEGERRHVAVLFADLVDYTRLTEELGAEGIHDLLKEFFARADAAVERAGGRVDKHIGDCVMAIFGAPISHGDDAARALRAALNIRGAAKQLAAARSQKIDVHIGLTMGSVVANYLGGADEYAVVGSTVNLASRLTDAAGSGDILISDGIYRALNERLECEAVGELEVKGLADPVIAWRLVNFRESATQRGPFVGRGTERRQFESILASCADSGAGHAVLLRGEAGIGKTRLTEEFAHIAEASGYACHRGLVLDFGVEAGRDAIRALCRELLGIAPETQGQDLQLAAEDAIRRGAIDAQLQAHLNDLLDAPQPAEQRALYDAMDGERRLEGRGQAIAQILRHAAQRRPRLLIVEDAHWAKPELLKALAQLTTAVAENPAVLVITSRLEGDPLDKAWRASASATPITTIDLSPLRAEDAVKLCQGTIKDPSLIEGCIERAAGNPLFLEQLLRHSEGSEESSVPGTIQSLVQASVDQLSPGEKRAIQACAIVGQRLNTELLYFLAPKESFALSRLIDGNLLRPHGAEYLFVHALIRDAIYETLLTPARKALHLRAAEWFEKRDARLYAEHLALAEAPAAPRAFLAAAREEIRKYHYETALELTERGLALSTNDEDVVPLSLLKGETLHDCGRMEEALAAYTRALEYTKDKEARCQALTGLAAVKRVTEDLEGAFRDLEHAEAELASDKFPVARARIHFLRGNLLFPSGDIEGCLREQEAGLSFAREAGRPDLEAASLGGLGDAEYVRGRMMKARTHLERCVALAREQGLGRIEVANQAQIAHTLVYTGPLTAARETAADACEAARHVGHLRAEINSRAASVKALYGMGLYEDCLAETESMDACIRRLGTERFRQVSLLFRACSLHALGRRQDAEAVIREALACARETGFAFHGPSLTAALATISDDPAEKSDAMANAEAAMAEGCVGHNQFWVYAMGVDVAFSLERPEMLRHYIACLETYPPNEDTTWTAFNALRGRALLCHLEPSGSTDSETIRAEAAAQGDTLAMRHWRIDPGSPG